MADQTTPSGSSGEEEFRNPDLPGSYPGETVTRRRLFEGAVQAVGGVAVAGIALPVVGFAAAPVFSQRDEKWEAVGAPDLFDKTSYRQVVITLVDDIGEAGKTTVYVREAAPDTFPMEKDTKYIAITTRCAHLGCPVRYIEAAGNFICPCHGGVYDFQGKVIGGPPVRPLDRFQTRLRNGQVEIGPRYSVTAQLEPVRTRDPGEFTGGPGGIWNLLYPPRPSVPPAP
ncbi:MAG: ubiquinol-cytochrome c reductase iron-sulfur subunit [Solirubrobacterales bacterium]